MGKFKKNLFSFTAPSVAKILLQKIILTQGISLELHTDQGTHFTSQVIQQIYDVWLVLQYFHCAYYLQFLGSVKLIIINHDLCPIRIYFHLHLAEKPVGRLLKPVSTWKLLQSRIIGYPYFVMQSIRDSTLVITLN